VTTRSALASTLSETFISNWHCFQEKKGTKKEMNSKSLPVWLLVMLALTLVLSANSALAKGGLHSDFEDDSLKPWQVGPNGGDQALSLGTGDDGCGVGKSFANAKFQHAGDNQAVWIVAPVAGTVAGNDLVMMDWSAKNALNCDLCTPMFYIGAEEPTSIAQFQKAITSPRDPIPFSDWAAYHYPAPGDYQKPVVNKGTIYVAIGFAAPSTKDKQISAVNFDCVDITVYPAP